MITGLFGATGCVAGGRRRAEQLRTRHRIHHRVARSNCANCQICRRDEGQAIVELALVLPIVVLVLTVFVQISGVVFDQIAAAQHTRHLARALAVSALPTDANAIEQSGVGVPHRLEPRRLTVERVADRRVVRVTVRYTSVVKMPWSGFILARVPITTHAVMLREHSQ